MRLDRNLKPGDNGKYKLILNRRIREKRGAGEDMTAIDAALKTLKDAGVLDDSAVGEPHEFFVIRCKDAFACKALMAYSQEAALHDPEYAEDVAELAYRSGPYSPFCKRPD